jgi:hypothetical protein
LVTEIQHDHNHRVLMMGQSCGKLPGHQPRKIMLNNEKAGGPDLSAPSHPECGCPPGSSPLETGETGAKCRTARTHFSLIRAKRSALIQPFLAKRPLPSGLFTRNTARRKFDRPDTDKIRQIRPPLSSHSRAQTKYPKIPDKCPIQAASATADSLSGKGRISTKEIFLVP